MKIELTLNKSLSCLIILFVLLDKLLNLVKLNNLECIFLPLNDSLSIGWWVFPSVFLNAGFLQ